MRELVVSDGGSDEATVALAEEWGAEVVTGQASRGGQLRRGCAAAKGEWLLVVHADTQLAPGWGEAAMAHMATQKAGWFQLCFDRGKRGLAIWANMRSRLGLPYGEQGLLLPKRLYERVGGYPDIPLKEDVELARALRGQLVAVGADAIIGAKNFRARGRA